MKINLTPRRMFTVAGSCVLLVVAVLVVGAFVGATISNTTESSSPLKLLADSAARGKNVSMATALTEDGREGVYILDHLNGNLQFVLINFRTNEVGAVFKTNVLDAMSGVKLGAETDFVLTTGSFFFNNKGGNQRPADSVAYVAEGKSGTVAAFGFQFSNGAIQRGAMIEGPLTPLFSIPIRELKLRDQ